MRSIGSGARRRIDVSPTCASDPRSAPYWCKVGTTQLLIGVAPGRVSTLHVLAEPLAPAARLRRPARHRASFQALLMKSLGK